MQQPFDGDVEGVEFIHLFDGPHSLLPMPAQYRPLVTVFAQSHAKVLVVLFDVMCVAWRRCIAH